MIVGASKINSVLPLSSNGAEPDVNTLTYYFLFLYFLMATQDIAVDGWALTMLSSENVGQASTCNSIGLSLSLFFTHLINHSLTHSLTLFLSLFFPSSIYLLHMYILSIAL